MKKAKVMKVKVMMLKMLLLLFPLVLMPICNAFPSLHLSWGNEISESINFIPPNIVEKTTYSYIYSMPTGVTAIRVRLACEKSISDYNRAHTATPLNYIEFEIYHYDTDPYQIGTSQIFEKISEEITSTDNAKNYDYVFIMNEKDFVETTIRYKFVNTTDYGINLCKLSISNPSLEGDSIDIYGLTIREIENQIVGDLNYYMQQITNAIKDLVYMIYEVILIFYWLLKIFLLVFAIGMVLWIFIWFYKLIKIVFRGGQ